MDRNEARPGAVDGILDLISFDDQPAIATNQRDPHNPGAGTDNSKGAAYNAEADHRSWAAMKLFFAELFGGR